MNVGLDPEVTMLTVTLRSVCCGIAAAVLSVPAYLTAGVLWMARSLQRLPPEVRENSAVGFHVNIMPHPPLSFIACLVVAFAIGFALGFRFFSRRSSNTRAIDM
jgi:hypothetical protein